MALYREAYIVRIASDPVALFWSGFGHLAVPTDAVVSASDTMVTEGGDTLETEGSDTLETEFALALGAGELLNIPDLQQLINGIAERLDFQISGISDETLSLALDDAPSVKNARVDVGRMDLDEDWQPIAAVEWEWAGEARSLTIASQDSGDTRTRTLTLSIAAGDTTRSRAPFAFFTDADQRRRSADDTFFSNVAGMTAGTSRRFGPS